ncbi:MAG: NUDIX domain-containing protein [Candidatus Micrarchaeia archaeon]
MRSVAADAFVVRENKLLLIIRKNDPFKGMFALPGGYLEDDETLEECVVRETYEETGLNVRPKKIIGVYSDPRRDPRKIVSVAYLCEYIGGMAHPATDSVEVLWYDIDKVDNLQLAADHNIIVRDGVLLLKKL